MVSGDDFYVAVKRYCRKHIADTIKSPYLTGKQKAYLLLLTAGSQDGSPGSWSGDGVKKIGCRRAEGMWEDGISGDSRGNGAV